MAKKFLSTNSKFKNKVKQYEKEDKDIKNVNIEDDEDDLESLLNKASTIKDNPNDYQKTSVTKGRKKELDILKLPISNKDPYMVTVCKEFINNNNIRIDELYDKFEKNNGWNMYYALKKRNQLTWKRLEKWAKLRKKKPIIIFIDDDEE